VKAGEGFSNTSCSWPKALKVEVGDPGAFDAARALTVGY
jgi:hypothetical protein